MEGPVIKSKSTHLHEKANAYQGRTETKAHQRTIHITAASVSDNEDLSKNTTKCLIQINQSISVCVCVCMCVPCPLSCVGVSCPAF